MNDQVKIFESPQFGAIRTAGTSDEPLFCLADICKVLELNPSRVKDRLNTGGVTSSKVGVQTGVRADGTPAIQQVDMLFVNEQNLYKVIMRSDKPQAEAFQDWVCGEVLPSIRKSGGYISAQPDETPEMIMAKALQIANATMERQKQQLQEAEETIGEQRVEIQAAHGQIEEQQKRLEHIEPMAQYTREVLQSTSTFTLTQVAKDLGFVSIHKFTDWARERGILYRQSGQWIPNSKHCGNGYFATRTTKFVKSDNTIGTNIYTVVTERGRAWLHQLLAA